MPKFGRKGMITIRSLMRLIGLAAPVVLVIALACTKTVEVEKIVEKIIEVPGPTIEVPGPIVKVLVTPEPLTPPPAGPSIYKVGIFQEPSTRNYWNFYGGPGGSVWTGYVLDGVATTLYDLSDQRFDWVPNIADGFPTALSKESIGGKDFWTTEVKIQEGITWSDGVEITADDFAFVVDTVLELELLDGNFGSNVDPMFLDHVEALDSKTVKVFFNTTDEEGNELKPGLSVWQYGLAFTPILPKHYWEPIVAQAKQAGDDIESQQASLFAHDPVDEPTAGGFVFKRWEKGAFFENQTDPNWYKSGTVVQQYENGAYREIAPSGSTVTYYGEAGGPKTLEFTIGPHVESTLFSIYSNQDSAILALEKGDIDYVFNPSGLGLGFQERIRSSPGLSLVTNPANSIRYLGFNTRKAPMDNTAFRQAIATVIDKEFVANTVLQGSAIPAYSMVPAGNTFWHNPDVPKIGQGLDRTERVAQAVQLLKDAGFTYEVEPKVSDDGAFVEVRGKGLKMPNGEPVPELKILAGGAGYDPMRTTFAIWIERWLTDIGIPVKADLTGLNNIIGTLFSPDVATELDMWILGWSLKLFPDYLETYFHSDNAEFGLNWGGYSNPTYDELALELLTEGSLLGARDTIFKLQDFVAEELPYVVLFSPPALDAFRAGKVQFPYTNVLGGLQFVGGLQQKVLID